MYNPRQNQQPAIKAEPLPEDYVTRAEQAIIALKQEGKPAITTSKLRSLFSLFTKSYNEITRGNQKNVDRRELNTARVRIYYEIGREDRYNGYMDSVPMGRFVRQSKLLEYLMDIGDSAEKLTRFYHYMEALVAFHRYYFGEIRDRS